MFFMDNTLKNIYNRIRLKERLEELYIAHTKGVSIQFIASSSLQLSQGCFPDYYFDPNPTIRCHARWSVFLLEKKSCRYKAYEQNTPYPIPYKKKYRVIFAPRTGTKPILTSIRLLLESVYKPTTYAKAYTRGESIITNANYHIQQNWVYNIDLKDFFFHINKERVCKRLTDFPFCMKHDVALIIASICCVQNAQKLKEKWGEFLPQGSPASPIISNAVCDKMDISIGRLARRYGYHYTRYSDDITISGSDNIACNVEFNIELKKIIEDNGFEINSSKTRCQHYSQRQVVTGLTVNSKVNIRYTFIKEIRSLLHIWEKFGYREATIKYFSRHNSTNHYGGLISIIEGKLNFIRQVKGRHNAQYISLSKRFEICKAKKL